MYISRLIIKFKKKMLANIIFLGKNILFSHFMNTNDCHG